MIPFSFNHEKGSIMKTRAIRILLFLATLIYSSSVYAATYRICLNWKVFTDDSGNGEDNYSSGDLWRARGNRYEVLPASGSDSVIASGYTSVSSGCFDLTAAASQFRIKMYLEAKLGANKDVKITTHREGSFAPLVTEIVTGTLSSTSTNYLASGTSDRINIMGIAQYVAHSWLSTSTSGVGNIHIRLRDEACPESDGNSSCASWEDDIVYIKQAGVRRKFNIGHEMGHMLYMKYRNDSYVFNCARNEGGSKCESKDTSHGSHAIHTKELASCALAEGFAHFVAVDAFNHHDEEDGIFYYYKSLYDPLIDVESGPTGGASRFLETQCSGVDTNFGVELDWLRAFWAYHTDGVGLRPTHEEIFKHVSDTHDDPDFSSVHIHQKMVNNAPNSILLTRWANLGTPYGIRN
jgi:hypothetical protein